MVRSLESGRSTRRIGPSEPAASIGAIPAKPRVYLPLSAFDSWWQVHPPSQPGQVDQTSQSRQAAHQPNVGKVACLRACQLACQPLCK